MACEAGEKALNVVVDDRVLDIGCGTGHSLVNFARATKVAGELLCDYYVDHYGLDVRGVRYPGVISSDTPPGGGTTGYAVEIFYAAIKDGQYRCFVKEDSVLPMTG